ncbi:unnamed protein product [Clonostachys rosea]|uniref:Ketoreductase (KR) domain-containing protein n=1 Tax=Bionectria ochroleuca TaxID=29856 RepID=A0ABY6UXK2_BIOOC|nr:unnamed protein product [Clonostachys rosea]
MVSIQTIRASNETALPTSIPQGMVAVFIGASSGIGEATLKQFVGAAKGKSPHVYIVGRSATKSEPLLAELHRTDESAVIHFIEKDVSLLRDVDAATDFVKQHETKVDLLFLSVGFISFEGRKDTIEGLEPSMTTRFYGRARAIQQLLPLLNNSENPHVNNVAAGGLEGPMLTDDLGLIKPGNYSIPRAAAHSTSMLTLTLERWAKENPKISFVHSFPGLTNTPLLYRGSSGITGFILQKIIAPFINTFVASSVQDVGARSLFHATNARYTVDDTASLSAAKPAGLEKAPVTKGGIFLVNDKSEGTGDEKVLAELRSSSADLVAAHLEEVFSIVTRP